MFCPFNDRTVSPAILVVKMHGLVAGDIRWTWLVADPLAGL
jgi:hypothetical protein